MVGSRHIYHAYKSNVPYPVFLTYVERESSRTEIREEGEGMPTKTTAELVVIAGEEALTLDFETGKSSIGRKWWICISPMRARAK
jgi:hypothetical protein